MDTRKTLVAYAAAHGLDLIDHIREPALPILHTATVMRKLGYASPEEVFMRHPELRPR